MPERAQRILITGADGQLGTALADLWKDRELLLTDYHQLDITDGAAVRSALERFDAQLLVNCAAYNKVDHAEEDPDSAMRINAEGPRVLAKASAHKGIPVVHFSTDYVFSGTLGRPYHEGDVPDPTSAYGRSKLAGEQAVRECNPKHFVVRTAWLFHNHGRNFLKNVMRLSAEKPELRVVNDQHGSPTYAPHLAEAVSKLVDTDAYGVFHMGGHGEATWHELTVELFCRLGIMTPVVAVETGEFPRPAKRPPFSVLVTQREPKILLPPWREGVYAFADAEAKSRQGQG